MHAFSITIFVQNFPNKLFKSLFNEKMSFQTVYFKTVNCNIRPKPAFIQTTESWCTVKRFETEWKSKENDTQPLRRERAISVHLNWGLRYSSGTAGSCAAVETQLETSRPSIKTDDDHDNFQNTLTLVL